MCVLRKLEGILASVANVEPGVHPASLEQGSGRPLVAEVLGDLLQFAALCLCLSSLTLL